MLIANLAGIAGVARTRTPPLNVRIGCLQDIQSLFDEILPFPCQDELFISLRFNLSIFYLLPLLLIDGVEFRADWVVCLPQQHYRALLWYGICLGWTPAIRLQAGKVRVNFSTMSSIELYRLLLQRADISLLSESLRGRPDTLAQHPRKTLCLINSKLKDIEEFDPYSYRVPLSHVGLGMGELLDAERFFSLVYFNQLYVERSYNRLVSCVHHLHLQGHGLDIFQATDLRYYLAYENVLEGSEIQKTLAN
ncbi:RNAi suppressor P0 [Pterostylis polerovirus]|nr:RNAi suppressor P0 [Pterostylis polerovirus]